MPLGLVRWEDHAVGVESAVDGEHLGTDPPEDLGAGQRGPPVRVVHDQLRRSPADAFDVHGVDQAPDVVLAGPCREPELADVVMERPAEVVPVVRAFQPTLHRRVDLDPSLVEERDLDRGRIVGRRPDGEAADGPGRTGVEPGQLVWNQLEVVALERAGVDPGYHRPLDDPGGPCGVAARHHGGALRQHALVRQGEAEGHLGGQVHAEQPAHPALAEQPPRPSALPHDRLRDDGSGIDRLEGINLYSRVDHRALADVALVGDHHAFLQAAPRLHVRVAAKHAAAQRGGAAHVGIVVDDGAVDERSLLNAYAPSQHAVLTDPRPDLDPGVLTDEGGADDLGVGVDLGPLPQPDPPLELEPLYVDVDLP